MNNSTQSAPSRVPEKTKQPYLNKALVALPLASAAMLGLALPNLLGSTSFTSLVKAGVITAAAFGVSYTIYRLAVEKGAPLAVRGFKAAGVISVLTVGFVGGGLWLATFPGLVLDDVEERRLQAFVQERVYQVDLRSAEAARAGSLVPIINAIASDLAEKSSCEIERGCVSLSQGGGYGPVARTLEGLSNRAGIIAGEAALGLAERDAIIEALGTLTSSLQEALADEDKSIADRRFELRQIDARISQSLESLENAVPVAMLAGYTAELDTGIILTDRPDVATRINGFLDTYAENIRSASTSLTSARTASPTFPVRAGASDTLDYIGVHAPIAILTFAVDVVFPLALWAFVLLTLLWEWYRNHPDEPPEGPGPSIFEQLTNRPVDHLASPTALKQLPRPRRTARAAQSRKARK